MKFSLPDLPSLPALTMPRLPLAAFRRRLVVRGVFLLLVLATLALAVTLLAEEKQRSRQRYEAGFRQTLEALAAQLRHPSGQLALLNAGAAAGEHLAPLLLPFSALDFDDPFKARQAVEMSGCALRWANDTQLCAAVGGSAYAGGFIYLVANLALPPAQPRERGGLDLQAVHRARVSIALRGGEERWVAPFEAAGDAPVQSASGGQRGRLTGFLSAADQLDARAKPDRDFRGWLWQDAECAERDATLPDCARRTLLSIRVPVQAWRDGLFQRPAPAWPPADLAQVQVRLQWLAPGGTLLFDSAAPSAERPFALPDLAKKLASGETLRIQRVGSTTALPPLRGSEQQAEPSSPWLTRLILRLPADTEAERIQAEDEVQTSSGRYHLTLSGDLKSVDRGLSATATRLSGFVGAMLAAIVLAWLVIEIGLMRRMAQLTKRAAGLVYNMQDPQLERRLGELDVADLRGKDELGILAGSLAELLGRVKEGVRREHIRAEQERDMWHAVGHEIMSPLQSLMVLHGGADDPSHRYVQRMQQAVHVLYGSASPSEAIAAAALEVGTLDVDAFLREVAANAAFAGISGVRYEASGTPLIVRADAYSLEDVVTHVLRNADRHRAAGTAITLQLHRDGEMAELSIHNQGPAIDEAMRERIFEYGVSDQEPGSSGERRGQGLFVARTYMAKMGGTIEARNVEEGVVFVLRLPGA